MRSAEQDDFAPNPWKARALAAEAARDAAEAEKVILESQRDEARQEVYRWKTLAIEREQAEAERDRLAAALRESDDMLRGWIAQMQDHPAYRGMALSSDTILREHAALSVLDRER